MDYSTLDVVVLARDLPEHGLRAGDLSTVVELLPPSDLEVEFVTAGGRTQALVTLATADVRKATDSDLPAVRRLDKSA